MAGIPPTSKEYFEGRKKPRRIPDFLNDADGLGDIGRIQFRNTGDSIADEGVLNYDGTDLTFNDGTTTHILENNAVRVEESGVVAGTRGGINFIEGANITITLADDSANDEVDVTIAASSSTGGVATGTYTGDGATSQAITGLGFQPKVLWISERVTAAVSPGSTEVFFTTDVIIDDNANGMAIILEGIDTETDVQADAIIALGADGFTVDDAGTDAHPNKNGQVYNYWALG